jgi:hypothetical protein
MKLCREVEKKTSSICGPVGTALRLFSLGFTVEDAADLCGLKAQGIQSVLNSDGLAVYKKAKSAQYLFEDSQGWVENRKRWEEIAATV